HEPVAKRDERARGAVDLHARAAQGGDQKSRDDGGEQPALGAGPARDRESDGERERHDADDDPGAEIVEELLAGVPPPERGEELRDQPGQIPSPESAAATL